MKKLLAIAFPLALSALLLNSAVAEETATEDSRVEITGIRNPQAIPYAAMRKGEEAFKKHHALAPAANLRFSLGSKEKSAPPGDLDLRLTSGDQSVRIAVQNWLFVLPDASEVSLEDPELVVVNRPRGSVGWAAVVLSPNIPQNTLRLGDLRLGCEVNWPILMYGIPFVKRMMIKLEGISCLSKKFTFTWGVDASVTSVTLVAGERRAPLEISADRKFVVPLRDASWPDDSLITLTRATP